MSEVLEHEHASRTHAEDVPTLKYGDEGDTVQELQQQLRSIGYCDIDGPVNADGNFSDRTHRAVTAFQRDYGLVADGIAGPKTWQALRHALQRFLRKRP
ncbi:MAG TPA: peptidoglycan-binding domain-containing protein [Dyella sp.]|uniref:peptidoglycan-binding domain-containing protein n=1 Tax=Dyella sp. TaxID=1869338 RepID=UPI002BA126E8|nr:peptidoglycan-binding domain-containing protein [Dyella sp.]HUB89301.1 peptidoglycan-binding domain-containing protein [Dyella sp.]